MAIDSGANFRKSFELFVHSDIEAIFCCKNLTAHKYMQMLPPTFAIMALRTVAIIFDYGWREFKCSDFVNAMRRERDFSRLFSCLFPTFLFLTFSISNENSTRDSLVDCTEIY